MWKYNNPEELYHVGILGMHWGKRIARGHAGPGKYLTKKSQLSGDKRDLNTLNNGGHLSVGFTKKRQAAFDARDKKMLEKRIVKNSEPRNITKGQVMAKGALETIATLAIGNLAANGLAASGHGIVAYLTKTASLGWAIGTVYNTYKDTKSIK